MLYGPENILHQTYKRYSESMYRGMVAQTGYDLTVSAMLIEVSKKEEELSEFARQTSCFIYHYVECKKILRQSINQVIYGFYNID